MPEQFHFIQPLWLLALLPVALLLWRLGRRHSGDSPWRHIVDPRLLPLLLHEPGTRGRHLPLWLLGGGALLAVLALANPAWERQPQPLLQTSASRVIVLDLSRSMLAADLQPTRLVRARFKVEDILAREEEGQTGLVVFAGDAFSVTPLTRDNDTIRAQLKALEPDIMPSQGSRADLGLLKAQQLLQQAGVDSAEVILIADGVEGEQAATAAARLRQSGYRVSVLGAGTPAGAPLPDGRGGFSNDASGKQLLVKLDDTALQSVARAGGGRYSPLTGNETDIDYLLAPASGRATSRQADGLQAQQWKQQGPLLAVLLLPLAALAFRRGWLLSMLLCAALFPHPRTALALGWDDLWLRQDQQAARALQQGHYEQAAGLAQDPLLRGSAEYRKGDYRKALDAFSHDDGADAAYNRGNALARLGDYREAIAAYDEALALQAGMEDAVANRAAVEALLKQQEQQQQQQHDQSGQPGEQQQQADNAASSSAGDDSQDPQQGGQPGAEQSAAGDSRESPANEAAASDPEAQATGGDAGENPGDRTDNAFADANRQLDAAKAAQQAATAGDAETPPATDTRAFEQAGKDEQPDGGHAPAGAEALSSEEQLAAQQWLRRIADDPGGLLRRKFLYQYRQRGQAAESDGGQDW